MAIAPVLDNGLIGFDPLYFDPFPAESPDEYCIPDRQKTPGDDVAIADYEPEKDKERTRLLRKWDPLTLGNPYLNFGGGWLFSGPTEKADKTRWNSNLILEDKSGKYPHITVVTCVDCVVDSPDTVLLAELSVILSIIRNRMRQEGFDNEPVYTILMLSFMGPQHGRIIHSAFDRMTLALQYSQLFNFERKQTAPLRLFF
ncbi:hypothetical protein SI65_08632 [Aspergillus cristatus]|uniref:Uncharacterized protein n=1 Tax=Aspergillus cristatus TaxID=573508 RepID=A0A1E3B4B7_ASPCR|nr:hypothetical protein SI65_08632 [Aspergillus cristatus]